MEGFDASSKRPDVRRILGPPGASGGGDHPRFGRIPDWERYETADGLVRFSFDGDSIREVMFFLGDP